jgi:hypothetical protein
LCDHHLWTFCPDCEARPWIDVIMGAPLSREKALEWAQKHVNG